MLQGRVCLSSQNQVLSTLHDTYKQPKYFSRIIHHVMRQLEFNELWSILAQNPQSFLHTVHVSPSNALQRPAKDFQPYVWASLPLLLWRTTDNMMPFNYYMNGCCSGLSDASL